MNDSYELVRKYQNGEHSPQDSEADQRRSSSGLIDRFILGSMGLGGTAVANAFAASEGGPSGLVVFCLALAGVMTYDAVCTHLSQE
jgi:hypothetical protein